MPSELWPLYRDPWKPTNAYTAWEYDRLQLRWTPREAIEDTVEAYLEAFSAQDPIALVLKTTRTIKLESGGPGTHALAETHIRGILARHRSPARIELIDRILPRREIALLHSAGDCYLSLSRGEGWGSSIFEAAPARRSPVTFPKTRSWSACSPS